MTRVLYTGLRAPTGAPGGLIIEHLPLLEVIPSKLEDSPAFLTLLTEPAQGIVLTSPRGVHSLAQALERLRLDPQSALQNHTIWVVGRRTAEAFHKLVGLGNEGEPALTPIIPTQENFEGLIELMLDTTTLPWRILSLGLEDSPRSLSDALASRPAQIIELVAYATEPIPSAAIITALKTKPDWLVLMSPKGVEAIAEAARADERAQAALSAAKLATIGPTTTAALWRKPDLEASSPSVELLLRELKD